MTRRLINRIGGERGSVLITGLLLSLALLMIVGAAVDVGHAFIVRRDLVSIADDAALRGSQQININAYHDGSLQLDPQQAQAAALQTIAPASGLTDQVSATTTSVEVEVKQRFPTILLRLVGLRSLTVSAQAQASPDEP
jgi:Flp pilus assembly protein TadG